MSTHKSQSAQLAPSYWKPNNMANWGARTSACKEKQQSPGITASKTIIPAPMPAILTPPPSPDTAIGSSRIFWMSDPRVGYTTVEEIPGVYSLPSAPCDLRTSASSASRWASGSLAIVTEKQDLESPLSHDGDIKVDPVRDTKDVRVADSVPVPDILTVQTQQPLVNFQNSYIPPPLRSIDSPSNFETTQESAVATISSHNGSNTTNAKHPAGSTKLLSKNNVSHHPKADAFHAYLDDAKAKDKTRPSPSPVSPTVTTSRAPPPLFSTPTSSSPSPSPSLGHAAPQHRRLIVDVRAVGRMLRHDLGIKMPRPTPPVVGSGC